MKKKGKFRKKKFLSKTSNKVSLSLGLFIILLMVASVLNLYDMPDTENTQEYNGLKFYQTNAGWTANLPNKKSITINTSPKELENISIDSINVKNLNYLSKIYLSTNPYDTNRNALYDFQKNIVLLPKLVSACYEDNDICANMPLKTCNDTTDSIGVIVVKEANQTKVELKDNCLTIQGQDLLKIIDKLIILQV